ncbi:MAG: hypothetical protein J6Y10_03950 [Lachnospiraceae bacterium]|nr:hypothetical protein [Lachnospiraceae bacterium]
MNKRELLDNMRARVAEIRDGMGKVEENLYVISDSIDAKKFLSTETTGSVMENLDKIEKATEFCRSQYEELSGDPFEFDKLDDLETSLDRIEVVLGNREEVELAERFQTLLCDDTDAVQALSDAQKTLLDIIDGNDSMRLAKDDDILGKMKPYALFMKAYDEKRMVNVLDYIPQLRECFPDDLVAALLDKQIRSPEAAEEAAEPVEAEAPEGEEPGEPEVEVPVSGEAEETEVVIPVVAEESEEAAEPAEPVIDVPAGDEEPAEPEVVVSVENDEPEEPEVEIPVENEEPEEPKAAVPVENDEPEEPEIAVPVENDEPEEPEIAVPVENDEPEEPEIAVPVENDEPDEPVAMIPAEDGEPEEPDIPIAVSVEESNDPEEFFLFGEKSAAEDTEAALPPVVEEEPAEPEISVPADSADEADEPILEIPIDGQDAIETLAEDAADAVAEAAADAVDPEVPAVPEEPAEEPEKEVTEQPKSGGFFSRWF